MNTDPREQPNYALAEAAHYLGLPKSTLRSWLLGQAYGTKGGRRQFRPLIAPADRSRLTLSFMNLVEAHVLAAIRRDFNVPLRKVRQALDYLGRHIPSRYPLADQRFETNGVDLFVRQAGRLVAVSDSGQLAMREMLERYLKRIERDRHGVPIRLYPFTARPDRGAPRSVVIDPRVSFGRPILRGTGISTAIVAERYKAGESMTDLAKDYGRPRTDIEEAIRCELEVEAA